jgi:hypothetical protein
LDFISSVINSTSRLCNNCYRFALVRYSDNADISFYLNSSEALTSVQQLVSSTTYSPGMGSNLSRALESVRTRVLNKENRRTSTSAVAIVITDNLPASTNPSDLRTEALATKTSGIRVMAVGINASKTDVNTLNYLSSYNDALQNFMVTFASDYSQLAFVADRVSQGVVKSIPWGSPASGLYCCKFSMAVATNCVTVGIPR